MAHLKLENVSVGYDDLTLLRDISFDLKNGEILSIVGHNASGKSSLLKGLFAEGPWIKGNIYFENKKVINLQQNTRDREKVSWMLQERPTFPNLSVKDILSGLDGVSKGRNSAENSIQELITNLPPLGDILASKSNVLSGGEKAVFSLAMCILNRPSLIFLDEPFAGTDSYISNFMIRAIKNYISERNASFLVIEHRSNLLEVLGGNRLEIL